MKELSILFLGASKRVSLLERFVDAAIALGIQLRLFSCEKDDRFCPISHLTTILSGPSFLDPEFHAWLKSTLDSYQINVVIPNMDSATVALSRHASQYARTSDYWPVVSSRHLCEAMFDKILARDLFLATGLPVPPDTTEKYPKIAKPRFGFGGKGIQILQSSAEREPCLFSAERYLIEDLISPAVETTVDLYFSPRLGMMGCILRDRLEVSDGEVMVCRTRPARVSEKLLIERVASIPGWEGCITLQYLSDSNGREYVIEINPRFGGGCTCAIEAGLNMPLYLMAEAAGLEFAPPQETKSVLMTRARRDFFCEC
jgi:carbamoyl-phosphate synthase large subunit